MHPVNLNLPYLVLPFHRTEGSYFTENRKISEFIVRASFSAKYNKDGGIKDRTARKVVRAILKKMAKAVIEQRDEVVLAKTELDVLRESLEKWEVPVEYCDWAEDLLESIEQNKEPASKTEVPVGATG